MQGILFEEASIWQFALVSCLFGGWTAWRTGKSVAESWQGIPRLIGYVALLGWATRFVHHVLFAGTLFSLHYYIVDTIVLLTLAIIGFRYCRTKQLTEKYYWLYEPASLISWKAK